MGLKEEGSRNLDHDVNKVYDESPNAGSQYSNTIQKSHYSSNKDTEVFHCRVCHCSESDNRGDSALIFLNISPPSLEITKRDFSTSNKEKGFVEFVSPEGEVFVCSDDLESGSFYQDELINLGCACKNELALAHYACALKWFINHGSSNCEICGSSAATIRNSDIKKIMASLKEYDALRELTATGAVNPVQVDSTTGVDPDALAAIRRLRLREVSLWFNPHHSLVSLSQESANESSNNDNNDDNNNNRTETINVESSTVKCEVNGTLILVAIGLLTVTLAWFIAPHVGKKIARVGLHILLGGICALATVIFLRFVISTRIKYGPARYWAILFIFWFLVFAVWASRTHGHH